MTIDLSTGSLHETKIGDTTLLYSVVVVEVVRLHSIRAVRLHSLRTPRRKRRKESARRAMETFLAATDEAGLPVRLSASPLDKATSFRRLVAARATRSSTKWTSSRPSCPRKGTRPRSSSPPTASSRRGARISSRRDRTPSQVAS